MSVVSADNKGLMSRGIKSTTYENWSLEQLDEAILDAQCMVDIGINDSVMLRHELTELHKFRLVCLLDVVQEFRETQAQIGQAFDQSKSGLIAHRQALSSFLYRLKTFKDSLDTDLKMYRPFLRDLDFYCDQVSAQIEFFVEQVAEKSTRSFPGLFNKLFQK
jgi:hypothetical protein